MEDDGGALPAIAKARRRWAGALLSAAAIHCRISDEIHDLEEIRATREWTRSEAARYEELRAEKFRARRDHDEAHRRLMQLSGRWSVRQRVV
jgi:multidrug resistance efflux pump